MSHLFTDKVNVFQGCGTINLPTREKLASTWFFIKGITGNCHPGATLPFGKYSSCMFTSAYPTGYGDNKTNSCPWDLRHFPGGLRFKGISHFHQSGTGTIGLYYNFAIMEPYLGSMPDEFGEDVLKESACPGYYCVKSRSAGGTIQSDTTVSERAVYHRFAFSRKGGRIYINLSNSGLNRILTGERGTCQGGSIRLAGPDEIYAQVRLDGGLHYFTITFEGAHFESFAYNRKAAAGTGKDEYVFGEVAKQDDYGLILKTDAKLVQIKFSDSLISQEKSVADIGADEGGFEAVKAAAARMWDEYLGRIEIDCDDEAEVEKFYSNLYQSLVKPSSRPGDCPGWKEEDFVTDISTIWDVYKTQFPLLFTLYPEISKPLVSSFYLYGKYMGGFPHLSMVSGIINHQMNQAEMLAEHSICDAYWRGVPFDYKGTVDQLLKDIHREDYRPYREGESLNLPTHLLDVCEACGDVADMLEDMGLGGTDDVRELRAIEANWKTVFLPETGLMDPHGSYYEGTEWNYSFRLLRHMEERMNIVDKDTYVRQLDRFFGFRDAGDMSNRFEGFNNETDMEAPYAYHVAGRMDRIAEICDAMNQYIFVNGRGGIPGNNDSGALSACYLWNAMGIFPVAGQNKMLVGSPRFNKVKMHLPGGKTFVIEKHGEGSLVTRATLDGEELSDFSFTASRMMQGGKLKLFVEKMDEHIYF